MQRKTIRALAQTMHFMVYQTAQILEQCHEDDDYKLFANELSLMIQTQLYLLPAFKDVETPEEYKNLAKVIMDYATKTDALLKKIFEDSSPFPGYDIPEGI